jgi:hypothetical protein
VTLREVLFGARRHRWSHWGVPIGLPERIYIYGWWFGTFCYYIYIHGIILPIICFKMVETTNQYMYRCTIAQWLIIFFSG